MGDKETQDNHDLLIKIVENVKSVESNLSNKIESVENNVRTLAKAHNDYIQKKSEEEKTYLKNKIKEEKVESEKKGSMNEKTKTLERMIWGSFGVGLLANIRAWLFPS